MSKPKSKLYGLCQRGDQANNNKKEFVDLDICGGLDFFQRVVYLDSLTDKIRYDLPPVRRDANKHPLKLLETVNFAVQLAIQKGCINIVVCKSLVAPMIWEMIFVTILYVLYDMAGRL